MYWEKKWVKEDKNNNIKIRNRMGLDENIRCRNCRDKGG